MHCLLIHQVFVGPEDVVVSRHYELGCLLAERGHRFTSIASTRTDITGRIRGKDLAVGANVPRVPSGGSGMDAWDHARQASRRGSSRS